MPASADQDSKVVLPSLRRESVEGEKREALRRGSPLTGGKPAAQSSLEAEVLGSLRRTRTPSTLRAPRSALGVDGVACDSDCCALKALQA